MLRWPRSIPPRYERARPLLRASFSCDHPRALRSSTRCCPNSARGSYVIAFNNLRERNDVTALTIIWPRSIVTRTMSDNGITMSVLDKLALLGETEPWIAERPLKRRLETVVKEEVDGTAGRARIRQIATEVNEAIAPVAACRRGCNHCCHQGLMVFEHEAMALAEASGRQMVRQSWRPQQQVDIDLDSVSGTPCPFLIDGSCSVYEHRPLFCRLRHSLNEDPDDCAVDSKTGGEFATYATEEMFIDPYVRLSLRMNGAEPLASIHRYFPRQEK